jgi:hypothetical protein
LIEAGLQRVVNHKALLRSLADSCQPDDDDGPLAFFGEQVAFEQWVIPVDGGFTEVSTTLTVLVPQHCSYTQAEAIIHVPVVSIKRKTDN